MAIELKEESETLQFRDPNQPNLNLVYWTRGELGKKDGANLLFWNQGMGEHIGRYKRVAERILSDVPSLDAMITYDMRGNGDSQGVRGSASSLEVLVDDVSCHVLPHMCLRYGVDSRVVIGGHSLGGAVISEVAFQRDFLEADQCGSVRGVILSSPCFQPNAQGAVNIILSSVIGVVARLPGMRNMIKSSAVDGSGLSHDEEIVRRHKEDEKIHSNMALGLAADLMAYCKKACAKIGSNGDCIFNARGIPTLVLHSQADTICNIQGSRRFVTALEKQNGSEDVKFVEFDRALHEIHNETDEFGATLFYNSVAEFLTQAFSVEYVAKDDARDTDVRNDGDGALEGAGDGDGALEGAGDGDGDGDGDGGQNGDQKGVQNGDQGGDPNGE